MDEEEVPATVTTTGLDVGVETTVVVEATPGEAEEVGVDTTVPAQDPLLPVTPEGMVTAEGEALAEETPTTPVATEPAFEEAMEDESNVILRLSPLLGHPVTTALDENVGEIRGAFVDTQGTLAYILLGGGEYLAENEATVAIEANLFTGQSTIAIPWQRLQYDASADHFTINADETALANAPTLNLDQWQQPVAPDWDADIRQFWQETE